MSSKTVVMYLVALWARLMHSAMRDIEFAVVPLTVEPGLVETRTAREGAKESRTGSYVTQGLVAHISSGHQ